MRRGRASGRAGRGPGLTHRREWRRDEQLVVLPDRPPSGLWRPRTAGPPGFLTDLGALAQILVHPGVDELVEPTELARPAGRQGGELLASLDRLAPRLQHLRDVARGVGVGAHLIHIPGAVVPAAQGAHKR